MLRTGFEDGAYCEDDGHNLKRLNEIQQKVDDRAETECVAEVDDTKECVRPGRYEFDLCELYARKFRKSLFENKGAFSNANFFQPIFDELQSEYVVSISNAQQLTEIGRSTARLKELHQQVKKELGELAAFCKTCKPSKKKKKDRDF